MQNPLAREVVVFDRSTVRIKDGDGRLHVETSNISKANVCPYQGKEIPGWKELGLDPDRIYQMYRDPEELAKAADSFNRLPLLSTHAPTSSWDHPHGKVIGATGERARFEAPYLRNSLVIWPQDAIDAVESGAQKELSCGYHYRPDMTPGEVQGEQYDGVMRDIRGNHVATVQEGRAGADVLVADSKPGLDAAEVIVVQPIHKENLMPKVLLSGKAALVQGALLALLQPKLAQDAQIDLAPALKGVTGKTYKARKGAIAKAVSAALDGKLATDANLDDLSALLDALEPVDVAEAKDDELDPNSPTPVKPEAEDEDDSDEVKTLKAKVAELEAKLGAKDADPDPAVEPKDKTDGEEPAGDEEKVSKAAMDQAIKAAVADARKGAAREQADIQEAERFVRPWVGDLAMSFDSAVGVYRHTAEMLSVRDAKTVHESALRALIEAQPKPTDRRPNTRIAQDEAAAKSYADRWPSAVRISA